MEKYDAKNIVEIGPRGYNYPEHYHFIKESGIGIFTARDLNRLGVEEVAKRTLAKVRENTDYVYMTVDIDALDMAYALGSGGQEPAGLTHFQLSDLILSLIHIWKSTADTTAPTLHTLRSSNLTARRAKE